MDIDNYEECVN